MALRARLALCRSDEWQKASVILNDIASVIGNKTPQGGMLVPRACRYCHYFGHSSNHCAKKAEDELKAIAADERRFKEAGEADSKAANARIARARSKGIQAGKGQAATFDEMMIPYVLHPQGIGPIVSFLESEACEHAGKWTVYEGVVVPRR